MPWFIVNGAMNRKLPELSEMPVMASLNVEPPSSDRWIDRPVFSRNSTSFPALPSPSVSTAV